jgi:hypothetical protein
VGTGVASGNGELGEENLTRHPPSLRGKGAILPSPCGRGVGGEVDVSFVENLTPHPPSLRGKGVILPSPCGRGVGGEVDERVRCSEPNPPSHFPRRVGGVTAGSRRERGRGSGLE